MCPFEQTYTLCLRQFSALSRGNRSMRVPGEATVWDPGGRPSPGTESPALEPSRPASGACEECMPTVEVTRAVIVVAGVGQGWESCSSCGCSVRCRINMIGSSF